MAVDRDAWHLALDAAVEALDHPVGLGRGRLGLARLLAERATGQFKPVRGEAAASVGQGMRDPEREGDERLLEEGHGPGLGLAVLDRQVPRAGAAIDGDEPAALAGGMRRRRSAALPARPRRKDAAGSPRDRINGAAVDGQVLDVQMHEAERVLLELARGLVGRDVSWPAAQPFRPENPVDLVPAEMGQA